MERQVDKIPFDCWLGINDSCKAFMPYNFARFRTKALSENNQWI
jgi:hypothetical protein